MKRASSEPALVSLVPKRFEDGDFSGVPRFDYELRRVFPAMRSLAVERGALVRLALGRWFSPGTIVITTSELSVRVPRGLRTIVVQHGCAKTHFDRDERWRDEHARSLCDAQARMFSLPNRWFVSPARWTAEQFSEHYSVAKAEVIPHWVAPFEHAAPLRLRPRILGDWRTYNKGSEVIPKLQAACPEWDFVPLVCTYETRQQAYREADVFLSLSLSEGGSYAVADAEAARMPVVMTDVGNTHEFTSAVQIRWQDRDRVDVVRGAIQQALAMRDRASFYDAYTFERWAEAWHGLIARVAAAPR